MTSVEVVDDADWRRAVGASGLLRTFNEAGILEASDVLVAQRLTALVKDDDERVALAVAFVVRGLRGGSVCVDLTSLQDQVDQPELPWPAPDEWLAAVAASPLVGPPHVLRVRDELVYLDRYWREEGQVADDLLAMLSDGVGSAAADVERLFPAGYDEQRAAADLALKQTTDGADRRAGHRQDHHGRAAAGSAGWPSRGGWRATAADRVGGADREGGGSAPGSRAGRGRPTGNR